MQSFVSSLAFLVNSPWRVIGVCTLLVFTAINLQQLAKFRFVEITRIHNHFGKEATTDVKEVHSETSSN
jgi:hypothetical protein